MGKKKDKLPAIPPEDYQGTISDWMVTLQNYGLWNGQGWYGDVMIEANVWWEIVEECERPIDEPKKYH